MSQPRKPNRAARRALNRQGALSRISLSLGDGPLPTEFRLFVKGWNSTEKGKFLFDDTAAQSVMSAYKKWGIDVPIDLEHQMLDCDGGEADPTARDARGWCKLELRPDGSLWAVNVTWTPDGAARLTEKRQRYVSPAFADDSKTKRVLQVVNIAITALPATHNTPALVAASMKEGKGMDPELVKKALDALQAGDDEAAQEILKSMIAQAAGAGAEPDGDEPGSEGDGAEGVAEPVDAAVQKPKVVDASAPPPPAKDDEEDEDDDKDTTKKATRRALHVQLRRLTGKPSLALAVAEVEVWRTSHLTLERGLQKLAAERATIESAERRSLVVELVKLGAEFPSTVWADDKATTIKPRWLKMPIEELRSHVADQKLARKKTEGRAGLKPPVSGGIDHVELSADELRICKDTGCDPKDFAALRATRDGGKVKG